MDKVLQKIIEEIEAVQIWGFEDCPQRFQVTNVIKEKCIKIVKKHIKEIKKNDNV